MDGAQKQVLKIFVSVCLKAYISTFYLTSMDHALAAKLAYTAPALFPCLYAYFCSFIISWYRDAYGTMYLLINNNKIVLFFTLWSF